MNFVARPNDFRTATRASVTASSKTDGPSKKAILVDTQADLWADRVLASMRRTFTAALETGEILIRAKAALPHGQWLPMLAKAGLQPRQAQIWMEVARNPRFANASPDSLLPPCLTTLYQIAKLPDDVFQRLLADGTIYPTVSRETIKAILRRLDRAADEQRILKLVPIVGKFCTLLIDPAWRSGATQGSRGCPYATMTQDELMNLPVPEWLEDNAHVYLCATQAELRNAFALFDDWGIQFNTMLVWNKTWPNGQPRMGMGWNFRRTCEFILFGVRGKLRTRQTFNTDFEAPVSALHSEKPDKLYEIVRAASYPPFGEVFGRKPREGFVNLYQEAVTAVTKAAA
jgi:N6-adenosine-specific RNA methylase IME4